jgi:hypothetical protein
MMRILAVGLVALMLAIGACRVNDPDAQSPLPPPYPSSTPNFSNVPPPTSQAEPGKPADIGQANPVAATPVSPRS